jgi:hypothetical protein
MSDDEASPTSITAMIIAKALTIAQTARELLGRLARGVAA